VTAILPLDQPAPTGRKNVSLHEPRCLVCGNPLDIEYFINPFSYVDITAKGCDGWLNLFFYDFPIALVNNVDLANKVRDVVPARANKFMGD
jgi:hypothetical protein